MQKKYLAITACIFTLVTTPVSANANSLLKNQQLKPEYQLLLVQSNADDAQKFLIRAINGLNSGKLNEALEDLNKVIKIEPDYADAYMVRGLVRVFLKQSNAIEDLDKAIRIAPNLTEAYKIRSFARIFLKDYQGAIEDLNQTIKINNGSSDVYLLRGLISALLKSQGAIEDVNKAIQMNPSSESYIFGGFVYVVLKDYQGAIQYINKAIEMNPKSQDAAYFLRGRIHALSGDYQKSVEDYNQAIIRKKNSSYLIYRGASRARLGDLKGAFEDYKVALQTNNFPKKIGRDLIEGTNTLGGDLFREWFEESFLFELVKDSNDIVGYLNRGMIVSVIGKDKQKGISDLQSAVKLYQQQVKPEDARKVLNIIELIGKNKT